MANIPDPRQWEVFTNQNCHPVETKAVRLAVVFAQSEFGFSERSYHCKHGAFPAAAVALAFQSRLPLASVIARSDLSLYALRYSTKRSDDLASLSDARLHLFSVHSLRANIRSFKSRAHAAPHHTEYREVIGPPP